MIKLFSRTALARIAAGIIVTIGILYVWAYPSGGLPSFTYDSFRYFHGAESILETGAYRDISGGPLRVWPPGTSLLYAVAAHLSGRPPDQLVRAINIAALLLTAVSLWLTIEITIARRWLGIIAFAAFMLNTTFLSMHYKLLSDSLALAANMAAFACAIAASRSVERKWYGWFCGACAFLSIAISFRFAMVAGVPVLALVAIWLSRSSRSHRHAVLLPFLTPLLQIIMFHLLGVSAETNRVSTIRSLDIQQNAQAFGLIADQLFPVRLLPQGVAPTIVAILMIAVPLGAATLDSTSRKRLPLLICTGFVMVFCPFLVFAQAVAQPSFSTDLRILFPIYPFLLIAFAVAIDALLAAKRTGSRAVAFAMGALLTIAAARSAYAVTTRASGSESQQRSACVSRTDIFNMIKKLTIVPTPPRIISNIQGLAWYALRIPADALTLDALANAPPGSIIIYTKSKQLCSNFLEYTEVDESALIGATHVRVTVNNDALLIARKD